MLPLELSERDCTHDSRNYYISHDGLGPILLPVGFADEKNSLSTLKNPINTSMRTQPITFADIFSICIKIGRKTHKTPAETSTVHWTTPSDLVDVCQRGCGQYQRQLHQFRDQDQKQNTLGLTQVREEKVFHL